jgi:hypothetical protein
VHTRSAHYSILSLGFLSIRCITRLSTSHYVSLCNWPVGCVEPRNGHTSVLVAAADKVGVVWRCRGDRYGNGYTELGGLPENVAGLVGQVGLGVQKILNKTATPPYVDCRARQGNWCGLLATCVAPLRRRPTAARRFFGERGSAAALSTLRTPAPQSAVITCIDLKRALRCNAGLLRSGHPRQRSERT